MSNSDAPSTNQLTLLLQDWQNGNKTALDELIPAVYGELRQLATAQLNRDNNASIQCTELVAEAYLKLINVKDVSWQDRNHFFSLAARVMRRVLVERFRARNTDKRGQGFTIVTFDENKPSAESTTLELGALDDALNELEELDARQAEIVTLRFFGGLKVDEIAGVLSISARTVKREWSVARLWLFRNMEQA